MTTIYTPKLPCPRDLGIFYCDECKQEAMEISSNLDYNVDPFGCRKEVDGKICGETSLGQVWCDECKAKGTFVPTSHAGQFEKVAEIKDM